MESLLFYYLNKYLVYSKKRYPRLSGWILLTNKMQMLCQVVVTNSYVKVALITDFIPMILLRSRVKGETFLMV